MEYAEKIEKFKGKTAEESSTTRTVLDELPIRIEHGSSTHHPDRKGGITTCDFVLWCKFMDGDWFRPYGYFNRNQIEDLIESCQNDDQVVELIEDLSTAR